MNAIKGVVKGKYIALSDYIRKEERFKTNDIRHHHKELGRKRANWQRQSRKKKDKKDETK